MIIIPMDPAVPSERKWDGGMIYYSLEGGFRTFSGPVAMDP